MGLEVKRAGPGAGPEGEGEWERCVGGRIASLVTDSRWRMKERRESTMTPKFASV